MTKITKTSSIKERKKGLATTEKNRKRKRERKRKRRDNNHQTPLYKTRLSNLMK